MIGVADECTASGGVHTLGAGPLPQRRSVDFSCVRKSGLGVFFAWREPDA